LKTSSRAESGLRQPGTGRHHGHHQLPLAGRPHGQALPRSKANVEQPDRRLPIRAVDLPQPELKLLAKIKPSAAEVDENPRARSAVMRVARRRRWR
jgi:hypothetical protein